MLGSWAELGSSTNPDRGILRQQVRNFVQIARL